MSAVIDGGLNKLANYEAYMSAVSAYMLATSMFSYILLQLGLFYFSSKPNHEATMVQKNMPSRTAYVKQMFLDEVRLTMYMTETTNKY